MKRRAGSEGIYFVVRLPARWELVVFRFDEHPDGGHPEFWERHVTSLLVKAWAPRLFKGLTGADRRRRELRLKAELDLHYDGFPRGRLTMKGDGDRYAVYHGENLKRGMEVTRQAIARAFGITDRADWVFDEHEQCSTFSAEGVQSALSLREQWKAVTPDFT